MVGITASGLGLMALVHTMSAVAQNLSFGADNFYKSDVLTARPISFPTYYESNVVGNIFYPKNLSLDEAHAAIVVGHPMGAVKEQSANLYAQKLAEQGFITVTLDLPFWGASNGEPRNAVLPDVYAEAYSAAVDFLGTQEFVRVDRERIGALGICGSGSFVVSAAKIDSRIKAVATSSMYDMGSVNRNGLEKSQSVEQRKETTLAVAKQRWAELDGADVIYSNGAPLQINSNSSAVDIEFYDYYRTSRGEFTPSTTTPNRTAHRTFVSNVKFLNFYAFNDIETISPRPVLFVAGDRAHSKEFSEDAYARAAEPKELYWVKNAGHVDLYDRVGLIPWAKLTAFFKNGLAENATASGI